MHVEVAAKYKNDKFTEEYLSNEENCVSWEINWW